MNVPNSKKDRLKKYSTNVKMTGYVRTVFVNGENKNVFKIVIIILKIILL